jgi:hypothetical protein
MIITEYRNRLEQLKGKKESVLESIEETNCQIKKEKRNLRNAEDSLLIVQEVGKQTQSKLEYHISELVSMALNAVFDNPYEFKVEFIAKRNKTECELFFVRDGHKIKPLEASGYGVCDVAGFALRVALWTLQQPKTRNTFILDEAFKHLKGLEENKKVIQMIKMLSEKLGLQILMIHDERVPLSEIEKGADRIFEVGIKDGISKVNTIIIDEK